MVVALRCTLFLAVVAALPAGLLTQDWDSSAVACPDLESPRNGQVATFGSSSAFYSCLDGFSLVTSPVRTCFCGRWLGTDPDCVQDGEWSSWSFWSECTRSCGGGVQTRQRVCNNPSPGDRFGDCLGDDSQMRNCSTGSCSACPIVDSITISNLIISVAADGESVDLSCVDGFVLVGNTSELCFRLDIDNIQTKCIPTCSPLPNPRNGSVEIIDGIIAIYSCDIDFTLYGPYERLCDDDGVWTGTDPECVSGVIVEPGDVRIPQIGVNPRIRVGTGGFDILSPEVLVTDCNATTTFNYRTTTSGPTLTLTASLLLVDDAGILSNDSIASTTVQLEQPFVASSEFRYVCLPLRCNNQSAPSLVRIGRVQISVLVPDGTAEVTDVNFQEGRTCDSDSGALSGDDQTSDCDNTTGSGDCGFRDTGCGLSRFEITLTSGNGVESQDEDDEVLVPLLLNRTTNVCVRYVCLPCLTFSGFVVTGRSNLSGSGVSRRRRATFQSTGQGKSFCLNPTGGVADADLAHSVLIKASGNEYVSFDYEMRRNGQHQLSVYALCLGKARHLHLTDSRTIFTITHLSGNGLADQACLDLHNHIEFYESDLGFTCSQFYIIFQGLALNKKLCIQNIDYLSASEVGTAQCRTVTNA